jgi:hypothetical protein
VSVAGRRWNLVWLLIAVALPGCAEEFGPERWETARVSGVVREGARPVGGGWIEFVPLGATVGKMRSAPIGPDGRYEVDRVPVGVNAVGFVGAPIRLPGGRRYFDTLGTPVRRTIPREGRRSLDFDLFAEFVAENPPTPPPVTRRE